MSIGKSKPPWANHGTQPKKAYSNKPKERDKFYDSVQWRKVRDLVMVRDFKLCQSCGVEVGLTTRDYAVDHIKPVNEGGSKYDPNNLQLLCNSCHAKKSRKDGGAGV